MQTREWTMLTMKNQRDTKRTRDLLITLVLLLTTVQAADISKVGTTAAPFLKIAVGARALAMGEAYVTLAEDASALFWNPGGISRVSSVQLLLTHYDYIADLTYDYGAMVLPLGRAGVLGAHFAYLGMPDIDRTTVLMPEGTGERVSAASYSAGVSYARALTDRFAIGGTLKMITEQIWHSSAQGVAGDLGLMYTSNFRNLKLGMSISNYGTSMQMEGRDLLVQHDIDESTVGNNNSINALLSTDGFDLPILFRVGVSMNLTRDLLGLKNHDLILAVDAVHPNDNLEYLNIGTEYRLYQMAAIRMGYRQLGLEDNQGGLTMGFGLNLNLFNAKLAVDYAAVDFGYFDYLNKFSLSVSF